MTSYYVNTRLHFSLTIIIFSIRCCGKRSIQNWWNYILVTNNNTINKNKQQTEGLSKRGTYITRRIFMYATKCYS